MNNSRVYSKKFHTEFIELYKQCTCLWKLTDKDYSNAELKHVAYQKLLEKLSEVDNMANIDCVKIKIEKLKADYFTEQRMLQISIESGTSSQNMYRQTSWDFNHLDFLHGQESPRKGRHNVNKFYQTKHVYENILLDDSSISSSVQTSDSACTDSCTECRTVKRKPDSVAEGILKKASRLDAVQEEDKCDAFGKHIAYQLRTMSSTDRIYAQKLISDIVFEVQLGRGPTINITQSTGEITGPLNYTRNSDSIRVFTRPVNVISEEELNEPKKNGTAYKNIESFYKI